MLPVLPRKMEFETDPTPLAWKPARTRSPLSCFRGGIWFDILVSSNPRMHATRRPLMGIRGVTSAQVVEEWLIAKKRLEARGRQN